MHRNALLDLLARYQVSGRIFDSEVSSVARMIEFVRRCPDCFSRALAEGHLTGSAWILNHAKTACLLTHHRKLGLWLQLGGHADGDSDVLRVARREALEESGIEGLEVVSPQIFDVDVHQIPTSKDAAAHLHYDVRFLLRAPRDAKIVVSEESHDLAWVEREQVALTNTDDSVKRMAEKWTLH